MKKYILLTSTLLLVLVVTSCEPKSETSLTCNQIELSKAFTAKIGEEWCIPGSNWKITFGPFIEDSRCNVPEIECIWAGRYVMGATIYNGETMQDTFFAVHNWQDTLLSGPYAIYLNLVKPEIRPTIDPLDPSVYSFEMVIK
jgi:hypothetical protein